MFFLEPWESQEKNEKQVPGHLYATAIENLRPFTQYKARIKATNNLGTGPPSSVIAVKFEIRQLYNFKFSILYRNPTLNDYIDLLQFWTLGDKPSGQPLDLKANAPSPTSLLLHWSDPQRSQWNGAILGYRAGWRRMRYV